MQVRFKEKSQLIDIGITALAVVLSIGTMLYAIKLICMTLSVMLLLMLTFFYARKEWKSYTKLNLWILFFIDMAIAVLYGIVIHNNPVNDYTPYLLTEIWIRPTIIYGLVACFVSGKED